MALRRAKIQPTVQEKRYITLQLLEAAYVSGNRVVIRPVDKYSLSTLSKENFTYKAPVETYIIYDERPKVYLLKKFGWFREDDEHLPQIAYIPTHLLYTRLTWNNGSNVYTTLPTSPTENDKYVDLENKTFQIYQEGEWSETIELITDYYVPSDVHQYYFDLNTHILYTSIYGWDNGRSIPVSVPEDPIDGSVWFDKATDKLHTYSAEGWDEGVELPTAPFDAFEKGLYYFDEPDDKIYTSIEGSRIINEYLLEGNDMEQLVKTGKSDRYLLRPLQIKRGTIIDVFFDFAPDSQLGDEAYSSADFGEADGTTRLDGGTFDDPSAINKDFNGFEEEPDDPYNFPIDNSIIMNRFYVVEPRIDTVSINYTCKLMAFKYLADKESEEDQNSSNGEFLNFNSDEHGA